MMTYSINYIWISNKNPTPLDISKAITILFCNSTGTNAHSPWLYLCFHGNIDIAIGNCIEIDIGNCIFIAIHYIIRIRNQVFSEIIFTTREYLVSDSDDVLTSAKIVFLPMLEAKAQSGGCDTEAWQPWIHPGVLQFADRSKDNE